jgi:hypothetical protein
MTNRINSYKELLEEKERLTALLHTQRAELRSDFSKLKEEFQPVKAAIAVIGKFTTKDKSNWLLTTAADTAIDLVVRKFILSRAGWLARIILPFFMKNLSSHLIADNQDKIFSKIFSWFRKEKSNGKADFKKEDIEGHLAEEEED